MDNQTLRLRLDAALAARAALLDPQHRAALRLFNGFREGQPELVIELYGCSAVVHNYAEQPIDDQPAVLVAVEFLRERLPWLTCVLVKTRNGRSPQDKNGRLAFGSHPETRVLEHGVWYALDLLLNRDTSLYLDTRNVRLWALKNLASKSVLNAFAYTGSLGVAALAGGAGSVVQLDRNRDFLNLAKTSYTLNGFPIRKDDFQAADFWPRISQFRRAGRTFDCVFLDPPFFAVTSKGRVDLQNNTVRLINKVRPLINDGGTLIAINNALFVSGREYLNQLESLCQDGYLKIEQLIPVPEDFTGFPETQTGSPPSDPAPFNHTTKIALLKVRRKVGALIEPDE